VNKLEGPKTELLRKVASIPSLLYNTDKETAKAILTKMEKDLLDNDMPYELITVYDALKKLHLHSPKYYEYSQAYNKHVAYTLALDKVEDLFGEFNKNLGEWFLTRQDTFIEILKVAKDEINNVASLYESHHLYMFKAMVNISFALYVPHKDEDVKDDEPIEDYLEEMENIINKYPNDIHYQYLKMVWNFYSYEYYHQYRIYKKEDVFMNEVNDQLIAFMNYSSMAPTSKFFLSKIESYNRAGEAASLLEENKDLLKDFQPDMEDTANYVNWMKYTAANAFYAKEHEEAIDILNDLMNNVSLRNYPHTEMEIKLFLALLYAMTNEYNLSENLLRSVTRKVQELSDVDYDNVKTMVKIIQSPMKARNKDMETKVIQLRDKFNLLNQTNWSVLDYLDLTDELITWLAKPIKETVY
jgi:hypothetical protein